MGAGQAPTRDRYHPDGRFMILLFSCPSSLSDGGKVERVFLLHFLQRRSAGIDKSTAGVI